MLGPHLHLFPGSPMPFEALQHAFQEGLCDQLIEPSHDDPKP